MDRRDLEVVASEKMKAPPRNAGRNAKMEVVCHDGSVPCHLADELIGIGHVVTHIAQIATVLG